MSRVDAFHWPATFPPTGLWGLSPRYYTDGNGTPPRQKGITIDPEAVWIVAEAIITNQRDEHVCTIRNTLLTHRTPEEVASAANTTIEDILTKSDKNYAIETMTVGTTEVVKRLYREKQMDGVMGIGGGQGTIMGTRVMQALRS